MDCSPYSAEVDLAQVNSSHSLAVLAVKAGSTVLDVGSADGSVARRLAERGCQVVGVELDAGAAEAAARYCERVVIGDVETMDLGAELDDGYFDAVLLLDVLEHLRDPGAVLAAAAARLNPDGHVIISVPNVTHAAVRLQLLHGRFAYTSKGLLDRTHLRFFDRAAVEEMIAGANLTVVDRLRTTAGLTETEIEIDPAEFSDEAVSLALGGDDADTYQFLYVLARKGRAVPASRGLGEALQEQATRAERARAEAAAYVDELEARIVDLERSQAEAVGRASALERELIERMDELERQHDDLEHLKMDVAIKEAQLAELRAEFAPMRASVEQLSRVAERYRLIDRISVATTRFPRLHRVLRRVGGRFANRS